MDPRDPPPRSRWPDFFPPGCPPESVPWASGAVLRFVNDAVPKPEDFVPRLISAKEALFGDRCQHAGLSVLTEFDDIARLRCRFPAFRRRRVAIGELRSAHGKLKPTPSRNCASHKTWWVSKDVSPAEIFAVIEPEAREKS